MPESLGSKVTRAAPSVVFEELPEGEMVLLDGATQRPFHLNRVGAHMWKTLLSSSSIGEAASAMLQDYEVEAETLWEDLAEFIDQLEARGLLLVTDQ